MAYLENATTIEPKVGNYSYLHGMKETNDINHLDEDYPLTPYTMEEIKAMIDEGEQQFAEGKWQDSEDMFRELEEESPEPYTQKELLEMAETGRRQIAEGKYFTTEEVLLHCLTSKSHHKSL